MPDYKTVDVPVRHITCKCKGSDWRIIATVEVPVSCGVCERDAVGVFFFCPNCRECFCDTCISEAAQATFNDYAMEVLAKKRKENQDAKTSRN